MEAKPRQKRRKPEASTNLHHDDVFDVLYCAEAMSNDDNLRVLWV